MNQMTPAADDRDHSAERAVLRRRSGSWLNGFLVGMLSLDGSTPLSPEQGARHAGAAGDGDDGEAPWHDQTMPIADRMKLAEGRPLRRRMMAAMAQQDCGQCGYNCNDYSDAIAGKSEARLNLCVPGGKETARMLKTLYEELDKAPAAKPSGSGGCGRGAPAAPAVDSRARPLPRQSGRRRPSCRGACSTRRGSEKETWHIDFDLSGSGLDYVVGDSFGVFARNDLGLVDQIIALLGASHTTKVNGKTLREVADRGRLAVAGAGQRCSSCSPSSPAARSARRRGRWRRARIPMAMPRRST